MLKEIKFALLLLLIIGLSSFIGSCKQDNKDGGTTSVDTTTISVDTTTTSPDTSPTSTNSLPDLKIIDIKVDPPPTVSALGDSFLIRGLTYSFKVKIKNVGRGSIQGAVAVDVSYGCPGRGSTHNLIYPSNNLGPDESSFTNPFKVTIETNSGSGQCSFEFDVDPYNVHAELDEGSQSNKRVLRFKVP